jgi:hypothetical protein
MCKNQFTPSSPMNDLCDTNLGRDLKDDTAADAAIGSALVCSAVKSAIAVDLERAQRILAVVAASEVVQVGIYPTIAGRGQPKDHAVAVEAITPACAVKIAGAVPDKILRRSGPVPGEVIEQVEGPTSARGGIREGLSIPLLPWLTV